MIDGDRFELQHCVPVGLQLLEEGISLTDPTS
jgi:hypothetical protein